MSMAIGIGTLLLGAWVLPSVEEPLADLPSQPQAFGTPTQKPGSRQGTGPAETGGSYRYGTGQTSRGLRQGGDDTTVPIPPTDPSLTAPESPWGAPTQNLPGGQAYPYGTRRPSAEGAAGPSKSRAPPSRSRSATGAGHPTSRVGAQLTPQQQQQQQARLEMMLPKTMPATGRASKQFDAYSAPPTVSPYLNMFRTNLSGQPADNYNTWVRPQIEQNRKSHVIGGEIRGLQSAARVQGSVLQRLGKKTETIGGTMAPEYFQNFKDYYPGFNR